MKEPVLEILRMPTAPRHEDAVALFIRGWLGSLGVPFREDRLGNLAALIGGGRRDAVAFGIHMDHPGFEVVRVGRGFVEGLFLGGVPKDCFRKGVPVDFFGKHGEVTGHGKVVRILEWNPPEKRILLRVTSGSAARGGFGMWRLPVLQVDRRKNLLINRAFDDLGGCAAALAMLTRLVRLRSKARVYAVFTRREEIGWEGVQEAVRSKMLPRSVPVISVETSKALVQAPQGKGPIVRVGDKKSIFTPAVTQHLCEVAQALQNRKAGGFNFQRQLMDGGTCESTAYIQKGFSSSGLCVALGNYHNTSPQMKIAAETIHLGDWKNLVQLMAAIAENPPGELWAMAMDDVKRYSF